MRSLYDYWKYLIMLQPEKRFLMFVDSLLFIVTLILFVNELFVENHNYFNLIIIGLLIFSGLRLLYRGYMFIKNNYQKIDFKLSKTKSRFDNYSVILPSEKEKQNGYKSYKIIQNNWIDAALFSDEINTRLQESSEVKIELHNNYLLEVRKMIRERAHILLPLLKHKRIRTKLKGQKFINEDKLCLSSDFEINSTKIKCHKGTYFDSFLTNECYGKCLISSVSSDRKLVDAFHYFPVNKVGSNYQLMEISNSLLNNHIGISTLALTSDNYIVFWKQNSRNIQDHDSLVPSASGSLDFSDLDNDYSLSKTICNGMVRELKEENMILNKVIIEKTIVLGYFRWVSRCGKPEFVGITFLGNKYVDLEGNEAEVSHKSGIQISKIEDINIEFNRIRENSTSNISLPLYMNMLFLEQYICNPSNTNKELKELLSSRGIK